MQSIWLGTSDPENCFDVSAFVDEASAKTILEKEYKEYDSEEFERHTGGLWDDIQQLFVNDEKRPAFVWSVEMLNGSV